MSIYYPAFALFALTIFVQARLGMMRHAAVAQGAVDPRFYRSYSGYEEPEALRIWSRHLVNLYEAPILFYAIVVIAATSGQAGAVPLGLAWAYVALRFAHSYVHLGSNRVMLRFKLFLVSLIVLVALWLFVARLIVKEHARLSDVEDDPEASEDAEPASA